MKRLTRAEFLLQPEGTFYFKESDRSLCIKHERAGSNDWWYLELAAVEPPDADGRDMADAVHEAETAMIEQGISLPMYDTLGRDGLFDEDETFFVYELTDLANLQEKIGAAIRAATRP